MSATNRKLRRAGLRRTAILASRLGGCICDPGLVFHADNHVRIEHDRWCPMCDAGTMFIIHRVPPRCER